MNQRAVAVLVLIALAAAPACRSAADKAKSREEQHQQQVAQLKASIPADSPLYKLELGMSEGEVSSILGQPSSIDAHTTGKQFIPFNFAAKDTMRTVYFYKGVGRVEFSSGSWGQRNGLIAMAHDPSEPGYRR